MSYRDLDATPGKSYYYLRVFQRDPENPGGDAEMAWVSPFFITYTDSLVGCQLASVVDFSCVVGSGRLRGCAA